MDLDRANMRAEAAEREVVVLQKQLAEARSRDKKDTVIPRSESLKKIDYVTALLSRLRGRVGVKPKFHKPDPKYKADS